MTRKIRNKSFIICSMLLCIICFISCKPGNQTELNGTYVADYAVAKEKLTLNKDGTFIQEVTLKKSLKVDLAKGTWMYDETTGYVIFNNNYMPVLDGFRKLNPDYNRPRRGQAFLPADKYFGYLLLGVAEGILYKKMD